MPSNTKRTRQYTVQLYTCHAHSISFYLANVSFAPRLSCTPRLHPDNRDTKRKFCKCKRKIAQDDEEDDEEKEEADGTP